MIKLDERKNQYGYYVVNCPACGEEIYTKMLFRHIGGRARKEGMIKATGSKEPSLHFDIYVAHTKITMIEKRTWKLDDFVITTHND